MKRNVIIDNMNVEDLESTLADISHKTLDFHRFTDYARRKNALNLKLRNFYDQRIFRKLKFGSYCRRQISESKMINNFRMKFGSPQEAVVCIGDWEQKKHRRFHEPVKGKGFRTLFRKAGYKVYLVDEFRTSKRCSACDNHGVCSTFRWCNNPRPYRQGMIKRHGLLKCEACSRLWNRDVNAASNIWKISTNAINGFDRPEYLRRPIRL